jgi:hypothetical protein
MIPAYARGPEMPPASSHEGKPELQTIIIIIILKGGFNSIFRGLILAGAHAYSKVIPALIWDCMHASKTKSMKNLEFFVGSLLLTLFCVHHLIGSAMKATMHVCFTLAR